jgi:hypothetical protein
MHWRIRFKVLLNDRRQSATDLGFICLLLRIFRWESQIAAKYIDTSLPIGGPIVCKFREGVNTADSYRCGRTVSELRNRRSESLVKYSLPIVLVTKLRQALPFEGNY